jgi:signal transduction histidine kinase
MRERLVSVRLRITLVATLVTGIAVLLASSWLVDTVRDSMTDKLHTSASDQVATVRRAIERGYAPQDLDLAALVPGGFLQIIDLDAGRVTNATPGIGDYPPLYTFNSRGDIIRIAPEQAIGLLRGQAALTNEDVSGPAGRYRILAASPYDPVRRGVDAVEDGLKIAFPLLVVAVGLLAWVLAGRALRPVEAIRVQVEAITASTLDRRVPVPRSGDEVARLATTMNAMLDRLEDASTRQQRFVADASHELRSPVAAIRTELEVAQRTAAPDEWPAIAERLLGEEARLEAVISDLLLLASLDEGPQGEQVPIAVADLVGEEARRRVPDREGISIEVEDGPDPTVLGNRTQLRRAVTNLLDNAGRHARTTVRVAVHQRDGRVRILVDDDGPGIPEEDRERVFERFTRLDGHRARDGHSGGSGLGLSLVRRIAELHQGSARIDTAPLGGARVVLDLPEAIALRPTSRP